MRRIYWIILLLLLLIGGGLVYQFGGDVKKEIYAEAIPLEKVPPELVKIAHAQLPDVKFDHARKFPNGDFEIRGKSKTGKVREVEVTPAGEIIEIE